MIEALGNRVRELRQAHRLTLDGLAAKTGISRSMISKIERGEADPTTTLLSRLAEGLGVSISTLVGGNAATGIAVLRRDQQPVFVDPATGFERRSLSPVFPSRGPVDFVLNTLPAGQTTGALAPHPPGVTECLAVAEGTLTARVGGEVFTLAAGDSLFFPADAEHALTNPGDRPCRYYIVIDGSKLR